MLYRHPDRIRIARLASERMAGCLVGIRHGAEVNLCVHNDELVHLVELCSANRWLKSCAGFIHGLARQEHPERTDLHRQQDNFLEIVNATAVLSHEYAKTVQDFYPTLANIMVVRPPLVLLVNEAADRRARRAAEVLPGTFLAAGRGVPQKGFDILLRALQNIPPGSVTATHLIVGHGDRAYEDACASLATRAPTKATVTQWTTRPRLLDAMVTAWAVVIPSRFEPLGLIAAEAMAQNIPVIASSVGGLKELVSDADIGWLVNAREETGPDERHLGETIVAAACSPSAVSSGAEHLRQWSVPAFLSDMAQLVEM